MTVELHDVLAGERVRRWKKQCKTIVQGNAVIIAEGAVDGTPLRKRRARNREADIGR